MDALSSPWHGRRVLVTGCTGFLGRAVTRELLDRGAIVAGLVRDPAGCSQFTREQAAGQFWPVYGRAEDRSRLHSAMAVHEVSAVLHMASAGERGTETLLQAAAKYHPRVPVVMVKPAGQLRLMSEDEPTITQPVGIARFGELFGSGERKLLRVLPRTVTGLLNSETAASTDSRTRDFVFVRDAARACLTLAETVGASCESLDCTFRSGWEHSDQSMAKLVAAVFAGNLPTDDSTETPENPLGWQPSLTLGAAVAETIAWYREFLRSRSVGTRSAELRRVA